MSESVPRMCGPLSPSQVADLLEIQQKIYFYGWCVDHRLFEELDALFMPDAIVHYDVPMGTKLPWPEMKKWLPQGLQIFRVTQHNMSNPMIELAGDTARARTYGHLIHFQERRSNGEFTPMRHHTIYHDEWTRQPGGWRIQNRRLAHLHIDGLIVPPDEAKHFQRPKPVGMD
ncbi:MAG: nuclear transport factor 2 family protein [Myxococcota bacterium]